MGARSGEGPTRPRPKNEEDEKDLTEESFSALAEVAVSVGVALRAGQKLVISVPSLDGAPLVRSVVAKAYEVGALDVLVLWQDERSVRLRLEKATDDALAYFPTFMAKGLEAYAQEGAAFLTVAAFNPDLFAGLDAGRVGTAIKAAQTAQRGLHPYMMEPRVAWSIIAAPTPEWAKKVFPGEELDRAVERLWEVVARASRVDGADPVGDWERHARNLRTKAEALNQARIRKLLYRGPGTDLSVELPEGHLWVTAGQEDARGTAFVANIPTEEVFTLPQRDGVNGTVRSTRPLSYGGVVIENMHFTFRDGCIVDYGADAGCETLRQLVSTDDGSRFLGEVALVPVDSPIAKLGFLFYNTLFDENASCHLAIGRAVGFTLKDGRTVAGDEALRSRGANTSVTHVDFMMGSTELDIDALTASGSTIPVFRSGRWAGTFA